MKTAHLYGHRLDRRGYPLMNPRKLKMRDAVPKYLAWMRGDYAPNTVEEARLKLNGWMAAVPIGDLQVAALTEDHVRAYVNGPDPAGLGTRENRLKRLKRFFDWLDNNGYIQGNPARNVRVNLRQLTHQQKEPRARKPFSDEEVERLLALPGLSLFWRFAIRCGRDTGLRLGDVCGLEWASLGERVVVWTKKTGQRVNLPMTEEMERLMELVPLNKSIYVWPLQHSISSDPAAHGNLCTQFSRLCKRAGIKGKTFKCLRNTFAQADLKAHGGDKDKVRQDLGHASVDMTEHYLETDEGDAP